MLYKEWRSVRLKFILWMAGYLLVGVIYIAIWLIQKRRSSELFENWMLVNLFIVTANAILGGVDLVAQERSNNTISFLLTRPISRGQVYLTKIALTIAGLTVATLLISGLMLAFDGIFPTSFGYYDFDSCLPHCTPYDPPFVVKSVHSADLGYALSTVGFSLILGPAVVSLSAIISIFFHNVMHALIGSVGAVTVISVLDAQLTMYRPISTYLIPFHNEFFAINFTTTGLLFIAAVVCVLIGTAVFRRKEF